MNATELLALERLCVRGTGGVEILRGVDLSVSPGEMVAILGPSGAGKTTILRAIVGLVPVTAGRVLFAGTDIARHSGKDLRAQRCQIGYIAQKHDLVEPLRVHQNVMAGALGRWSAARALRYLLWQTPSERKSVQDVLRSVGLNHHINAPTSRLSGGEQQRVAIARSLLQNPKLLLADEPVASLDPEKANEILQLLVKLASEHNTALLCTLHQPELARRYFHRIVRVEHGLALEPQSVESWPMMPPREEMQRMQMPAAMERC
jgi:phosphonate transport system ATP-binding protein